MPPQLRKQGRQADDGFFVRCVVEIAQQDDPTQFTVLPEVLEAEEYGIAFRKGEQTLADAVSQQLVDMFKDGTLDTIRAKWFANDITQVAQYAN